MHGESHSELKSSSGFFFLFFFLGCFSATVTQSRLQRTCAGEDCRVLSFQTYPHLPCHVLELGVETRCRSRQQLVSTTDELETSLGSWPVRGPARAAAVLCVSTGSHALFIRQSSLLKAGPGCAASAALTTLLPPALTTLLPLALKFRKLPDRKNFRTSPPPLAEQTLTVLSDGYKLV